MTLRNVVVMLVLAVLCALAYVALRDVDPTPGRKLPPTFPAFVKEDVRKITVQSEGRSIVLLRRTDRSDAWEVTEGTGTVRADAAAVDELLTQILRQDVKDRYPRSSLNDADLRGYGLDAPQATVELDAPKAPVTVRYGTKTRDGGSSYLDTGDRTDVWVVGGDVISQITTLKASGARSKRFTDLRLFDVGKVEIVKGGVTTFEAERDASQIWRTTQPWKGYADPGDFEQFLDRLVTTELSRWAEVGAQDLKPWGLDAPRAEVRLTHRKGGDPVVLLVGNVTDAGVFLMEKGRPNVALVPKRFAEAVDTDPLALRDRSFSRIGNESCVAVRVNLGTTVYELRKSGANSSWDVTQPAPTQPGDDPAAREALDLLRAWRTVEFNDAAKPSDFGIAEKGDSIEVEFQGGGKATFRLGKEGGTDGTRWAQRISADGEGGVERVDGAPLERLAKGYPQFRRKLVRDYGVILSDLERISREAGRSDEGKAVQSVVIEREVAAAKAEWKLSPTIGPRYPGNIDAAGVNAIYAFLSRIIAKDWLFWSTERNEEMGFYPPVAETLALTLEFSTKTSTPKEGPKHILLIGKKREQGGYFARFLDDEAWAFVLSDEDVKELLKPLVK